jgi:hypothetical protein
LDVTLSIVVLDSPYTFISTKPHRRRMASSLTFVLAFLRECTPVLNGCMLTVIIGYIVIFLESDGLPVQLPLILWGDACHIEDSGCHVNMPGWKALYLVLSNPGAADHQRHSYVLFKALVFASLKPVLAKMVSNKSSLAQLQVQHILMLKKELQDSSPTRCPMCR